MRLYTMCIPSTCRDQKKVIDLLELELWVTVNHSAVLGTNLVLLQEQQGLLTSVPSPAPLTIQTTI